VSLASRCSLIPAERIRGIRRIGSEGLRGCSAQFRSGRNAFDPKQEREAKGRCPHGQKISSVAMLVHPGDDGSGRSYKAYAAEKRRAKPIRSEAPRSDQDRRRWRAAGQPAARITTAG